MFFWGTSTCVLGTRTWPCTCQDLWERWGRLSVEERSSRSCLWGVGDGTCCESYGRTWGLPLTAPPASRFCRALVLPLGVPLYCVEAGSPPVPRAPAWRLCLVSRGDGLRAQVNSVCVHSSPSAEGRST